MNDEAMPTREQVQASQMTIIWTDAPGDAAISLRDQVRSRGEKCTIRDACFFALNSVEPARRLLIFNAYKRDAIVAGYRSEGYVRAFGRVEIIDVQVDAMGAPTQLPAPIPEVVADAAATEAAAAAERDQLEDQLLAMSPDDLRTYVTSMTGVKQRWNASAETLIKNLRTHLAGGKLEEVPEEETRPPTTEQTPPTPPSDGIGAEGE